MYIDLNDVISQTACLIFPDFIFSCHSNWIWLLKPMQILKFSHRSSFRIWAASVVGNSDVSPCKCLWCSVSRRSELIPTLFYFLPTGRQRAHYEVTTRRLPCWVTARACHLWCFWESESALRLRNNTNANPGVPASALKVLNYPSLLRVPYCKPALRLFSVGSHFGVLRSPGAVLNEGQKF